MINKSNFNISPTAVSPYKLFSNFISSVTATRSRTTTEGEILDGGGGGGNPAME